MAARGLGLAQLVTASAGAPEKPTVDFADGLRQTVAWYVAHPDWWRPLKQRLAVQEGEWANRQ